MQTLARIAPPQKGALDMLVSKGEVMACLYQCSAKGFTCCRHCGEICSLRCRDECNPKVAKGRGRKK